MKAFKLWTLCRAKDFSQKFFVGYFVGYTTVENFIKFLNDERHPDNSRQWFISNPSDWKDEYGSDEDARQYIDDKVKKLVLAGGDHEEKEFYGQFVDQKYRWEEVELTQEAADFLQAQGLLNPEVVRKW